MKNSLEVNPTAALAMIQKGALLVDVREPREISKKSFDLPNVMQIPLGEFKARYREIPENRQVVVACRSGSRSQMATSFLAGKGYRKASNMRHGLMGWENAGLPIKQTQKQTAGGWLQKILGGKA